MTPDDVRALALALDGTVEQPHHQRTSFRVDGRIFATMDDLGVNVMLDEEPAREAATDPGVELLWWGRKLSGVRVLLTNADRDVVAELLDDAWQRRRRRS
jgi:YjbR